MNYVERIAVTSQEERKNAILSVLDELGLPYEIHDTVWNEKPVSNFIVSLNPSDHRLVIGSHWDSVADSTGANDNASSCSILLRLCEHLRDTEKSVDFVFFGEEEKGGIGASRYIESVGKENISAMINADVCGFGDHVLLSDKGNLSNPLFCGLMDEALLKKHNIQLPGFLPQGDDCIFEWGGIPSVSICCAEGDAVAVFAEIGRKIATEQPITEADQEALMGLDVVKTMHGGEFDDISYLSGEAVKMVADYLSDGLRGG